MFKPVELIVDNVVNIVKEYQIKWLAHVKTANKGSPKKNLNTVTREGN